MARSTRVITICDRHRGEVEAAGTVEVVIDGERRKLDLCADHLSELRRLMRPWLKSPGTTSARRSGVRKASRRGNSDAAVVRQWALDQGYDLPARGRIPNDVREAYKSAR